jgi:hypothetical protein
LATYDVKVKAKAIPVKAYLIDLKGSTKLRLAGFSIST